jgi:hypothetical protein
MPPAVFAKTSDRPQKNFFLHEREFEYTPGSNQLDMRQQQQQQQQKREEKTSLHASSS